MRYIEAGRKYLEVDRGEIKINGTSYPELILGKWETLKADFHHIINSMVLELTAKDPNEFTFVGTYLYLQRHYGAEAADAAMFPPRRIRSTTEIALDNMGGRYRHSSCF